MKQHIYGMKFDYESGVSMTLTVCIDPSDGLRIIPYQVRIMQENRLPKLLPFTTEEVDGKWMLRYDISSKRKGMQLLHMQPTEWKTIFEALYLLVQTLCDCNEYMLDENHFALNEDLLFAGETISDVQLCYLPVDGLRKRPVTEELRCLLLRMLSALDGPIPKELAPILGLLSEQFYSLRDLNHQLKLLWLKGQEQPQVVTAGERTEHHASSKFRFVGWRLENWLEQIRKKPGKLPIEQQAPAGPTPNGKTEYLAPRKLAETAPLLLIRRNGTEQQVSLTEDRWIIGRNGTGVHYSDPTDGVSRLHCEIVKGESGVEAKDLGSLNGTYMNGERMIPYKSYALTFGDVLRYVQTEIRMANERQFSQPVEQDNTMSH